MISRSMAARQIVRLVLLRLVLPLKSLPDKPQSPRKLPAKTVHRRPRKAAPPSPSRATTSALVQLGTTLQALGAQLVNSVVDCAV